MNTTLTQKGALSIDEFRAWSSIGKTRIYKEIKSGRLKITKIGRRTIITLEHAVEWLELNRGEAA